MSQLLTPQQGAYNPEVQITPAQARLKVLSPQYIIAKGLESRPTEWIPGGRPIYGRLPSSNETYQINFYNRVVESNITGFNSVQENIQGIGYVFIPWGESINGPTSLEVVETGEGQSILIKGGTIIWKYGKTEILPTIVDLSVIEAARTKYEIGYQLIYDDAAVPQLYNVTDFALTGQPLDITSSTDSVVGWRYPAINAFLNTDDLRWSNEDSFFATSVQPTESYLQWESELPASYESMTLRCPLGTSYSGTATLHYVSEGEVSSAVETVSVSFDEDGQYFQFNPVHPSFQNGWRVEFSSPKVSIQAITVSGTVTLMLPPLTPTPRATLVMYPRGTSPDTVTNSEGEKVPVTYAFLADVDVGLDYQVGEITDRRDIIHRDYVPVANWLTTPFDQDLIYLYEQVTGYSSLWMAPPSCMKQEELRLESSKITVEV